MLELNTFPYSVYKRHFHRGKKNNVFHISFRKFNKDVNLYKKDKSHFRQLSNAHYSRPPRHFDAPA